MATLLVGLQWLVTTIVGSLSKTAADAVLTWLNGEKADAAQRQLGQQGQTIADQGGALAATQRMIDAAAEPKGPSLTKKALDEGLF